MLSEEALQTISDVVKSWEGIRPRGAWLFSFMHNDDGTLRTDEEAMAYLDKWVAQQQEFENAERLQEQANQDEAEWLRHHYIIGHE